SDGRLTIRGLGHGRVARVQLHGPAIESAFFYVRSSAGQTLKIAHNAGRPDDGTETWYPAEFTHAVGPSQPVIGQITDADSGQPLAGFTVQGNLLNSLKGGSSFFLAGQVKTTTDAEGRFRLDGLTPSEKLPRGVSTLLVLPPRGSH